MAQAKALGWRSSSGAEPHSGMRLCATHSGVQATSAQARTKCHLLNVLSVRPTVGLTWKWLLKRREPSDVCCKSRHFFRFLFPVFLGSCSAGVLSHKFHVTTGLRGEGDLKALMKPPDPRHCHAIICIDLIDASVTIPKLSMIAT